MLTYPHFGRNQARLNPNRIMLLNNDAIAGGNYVVVGTTANKYFRYFGDSDGNGALDQDPEFIAFRNGFGSPSTIFDFDDDGSVDQDDFIKFRNNFGGAP